MKIDDYIKKPYLPAELELHIKAILRRVRNIEETDKEDNEIYHVGTYLFNLKNYCLQWGDEFFDLTAREAQILQLLCVK